MVLPKWLTALLNIFFPSLIFRIPGDKKILYLTFDDGPCPETTNFILKTLEEYNAKATFFCSGENAEDFPELFQNIFLSENQVGNHGWNHKDAFRVRNSKYMFDIERTEELIGMKLFRPPFGRLWPWQVYSIQKNYKIVMWEIMIPDYKADMDCEKAMSRLFPQVSGGSIIVMHDSAKAQKQLRYILPKLLEYFSQQGFSFEAITLSN